MLTGLAATATTGVAHAKPDLRQQVIRDAARLEASMKALHGDRCRLCMDEAATMVMVLAD